MREGIAPSPPERRQLGDASLPRHDQGSPAGLLMQLPFPVALYVGDQHILRMANPAYHSLGNDISWFHTPADLDHVYRSGNVIRRAERQHVSVRSGVVEHRFFDVTLSPLLPEGAAGPVEGVIAAAVEVTDQVNARRRAEDAAGQSASALEHERRRLETVLRSQQVLVESVEEARRHSEQARAEAENANRLKDSFLATVSHELRTPMAALLLWENILRAAKDEPMRRRALDAIRQSAAAQSKLIDDLLDVSRCISGKLRIDLHPVPVVPIVEAAIEVALPVANAKGIRMDSFLDHSLGNVMGDPDRLQQIVGNLLANAIKFTDADGRITVRAERRRTQVEIAVVDTGQGIPVDFLPEIFKPFTQADGSVTRNQGGLGLGLAIVWQLVELHAGTVRAESGGPNRGAALIVTLPLHQPPAAEGLAAADVAARDGARHQPPQEIGDPPSDRPNDPPNLDGLDVLVVDDEPRVREALTLLLRQAGARVKTVDSAASAMIALVRSRWDVVISDIGMPGEDGFSFMSRLRALSDDQGGGVPAVALTAYARAEDESRALDVGFDLHLAKPVEADVLISAIARLRAQGHHPR